MNNRLRIYIIAHKQFGWQGANKMTITDVAEALGVSTTTVSRAISGKGRIGKATRSRVLEYIEKHDYQPNVIARSLAESKTYNVALVLPNNNNFVTSAFFQKCMVGINRVTSVAGYDMIVTMTEEGDEVSKVEKLVRNNKVDGVILSRVVEDDKVVSYLKENKFPFVVIGAAGEDSILQVDHDHVAACKELTTMLLMKGYERLALIGGNSNNIITERRLEGFSKAFASQGKKVDKNLVFLDAEHSVITENFVLNIVNQKVDCIVCMDDSICYNVINILKKNNIDVPKDVRVASFYNSSLLENNSPSITSLQFDGTVLGMSACQKLLDSLEGKEVETITLFDYEVVFKESTK